MRRQIEDIIAVWMVGGWVLGSTVLLIGLGMALWGIFTADALLTVRGAGLTLWGYITVFLGVAGSRFLVKTFIETPK